MNRDLRLGVLAAVAAMVPGILLLALGVPGSLAIIVTIGCGVGVVVALDRRWHYQSTARTEHQTAHLRGAIGVAATAGGIPTYWTEHSITPETLTQIQQLIAVLGMRNVLELGSGLSTLMIAHAFRRVGGGKVLSLDDDARWAAQTTATLEREGLASFAEVRVAPLKDVISGGRTSSWYDISTIAAAPPFDLVIVDGPPAWKGDRLARLPALYELRKHLSENGVLVLDDAGRGGEAEIARQWQHDFPDLHFRMVGVGRGLFVASVQASTLDLLPWGKDRMTELKVYCTIGMQAAVEEMLPSLEKASGCSLAFTWATAPMLVRRLQAGERADVMILNRAGLETMTKEGRIVPGSATKLAGSPVAIAVKGGAPKPDISTVEALKRTLLAAKSISYTDPAAGGASGVHFAKVLEQLGIAHEVNAKNTYPPAGGFSGTLLVSGQAELAVQQKPELLHVAGIEVIGLLPGDLNLVTVFVAGIGADCKSPNAARTLIDFLTGPEAALILRKKGLDPDAP